LNERDKNNEDLRLIEAGFPCHQVGAETQRERDTGKAPPPNRLHVWWARRPLTPSRAAILASLLPGGTDPDWFLRQLGIEKVQAMVNGVPWTLTGGLIKRLDNDETGNEVLPVDKVVLRAFVKEQKRRKNNLGLIAKIIKTINRSNYPMVDRWRHDTQQFVEPFPVEGSNLLVERIAADPALANKRIKFGKSGEAKAIQGGNFKWDDEDLYCYDRAFTYNPPVSGKSLVILDPTAGGGSIPLEALRLGHEVIANEINPVASTILHATLSFPISYGPGLIKDVELWAKELLELLDKNLGDFFPNYSPLPDGEFRLLQNHLQNWPELISKYNYEDIMDYIYVRQVTCPHCGGEAPLLNTCWLAKDGERWGVKIVTDGKKQGGKVNFETYRIKGGKGPGGEDPDFATVKKGIGTCIHCRQAIPAEEIKLQARGESPHGRWKDRLYCVVAVRHEPRLDEEGQPQIYKSGKRKGKIKTRKVRFFRAPNKCDLEALKKAEERLKKQWDAWERAGLIPTEKIPAGHKTMEPLRVGVNRWCDLFTPRQLLGHLLLVEELNRLKPQILEELGYDRGRAVVTYLQFMIDKGLDYNSKQTRWEYTRGIVKGTFGRHDFSLKWTFGEMIFSGPNSGAAWGLSQVLDAYKGIAKLVTPLHEKLKGNPPPLQLLHGTAAHMDIPAQSVDLICMDPPYYNNVQYAELSDYFYVWQRRTLGDLYPELMQRRLTNKKDEAVANPARDGSGARSAKEYQRLMGEIFTECRRVLKDSALMTIMFTHKTAEAWEALTRSLIESGWIITSSMPVESEATESIHQKGMASAASSVFLTCRKRQKKTSTPSVWKGFGDTGVAIKVQQSVRQGLKYFDKLDLNPVDEMVAAYGRALWVLSEYWPVLDGDEFVSPSWAMLEASTVVAQHQFGRLTGGRLKVEDLISEAAAVLTFYGIFNMEYFSYDQALNLSRALNLQLKSRPTGYRVEGLTVGIGEAYRRRRGRPVAEEPLYHAPLIRSGSRLRLVLPEERHQQRLKNPQTEWDMLQGLIISYRSGDSPLARDYLTKHCAGREQVIMDLLSVWSAEARDEAQRKEGEAILFSLR
jgi:putative DNA methylase